MSLSDQIRCAVAAAPRVQLNTIRETLWRAWGQRLVTDDEAEELSALIDAKLALPSPSKPLPRRVGSRPRSPESLERRRRWTASGRLPPRLAMRFTMAEQSVLAVVAVEVIKRGACTLTVPHIAALAGVSETTVRNALREAKALGLVTVEERRQSAWRNAPNVVRIVMPEWRSWLRLSPQGGGCKSVYPTHTDSKNKALFAPERSVARAAGGQRAESTALRRRL
ncbi:GntR family transcriptional regulator [Microvirga mediterraneensis]|uniref:GntR family transcriptional regulator n=1 Tax=Microvirga mediterraneensis TaxID=2754695 RepID=A0A838BWY9_9HYPH|nr:GntR family transcriptional regulator [Microvirga mediterraneensis]MBA1159433.1 GntR family transcriptional regulator [Microvirga mediterraneensis]